MGSLAPSPVPGDLFQQCRDWIPPELEVLSVPGPQLRVCLPELLRMDGNVPGLIKRYHWTYSFSSNLNTLHLTLNLRLVSNHFASVVIHQ